MNSSWLEVLAAGTIHRAFASSAQLAHRCVRVGGCQVQVACLLHERQTDLRRANAACHALEQPDAGLVFRTGYRLRQGRLAEAREARARSGGLALSMTLPESRRWIAVEIARWDAFIESTGVKPEQ